MILKATKRIDALLPPPVILKRRAKAPPSGVSLRRSRCVAGVQPCSPGPIISTAKKIKVMRSMGFGNQEKFSIKERNKIVTASFLENHFQIHTSQPLQQFLAGRWKKGMRCDQQTLLIFRHLGVCFFGRIHFVLINNEPFINLVLQRTWP